MEICADGAAIHRSQAVRDWLTKRPGRVHLERLPAYSPELNPPGRQCGGVALDSVEAELSQPSVQ